MKKVFQRENIEFPILVFSYSLFFVSMGAFLPYVNLYYERLGLQGNQIGLINAVCFIAVTLCSPIWGGIADKTGNYKGMVSFLVILAAITGIIWQRQRLFIWIFLGSLLLKIFRNNILNIFDSLCIQYCNKHERTFSTVRSMGSLGYLVGTYLIGNFLYNCYDLEGPYMGIVFIVSILLVILLRYVQISPIKKAKNEHQFTKNIGELFHNSAYNFILLLNFFGNIAMDSANGYTGNHLIMTLNLSDDMIGLNVLATVLPEVIFVMYINKILKKWGLKRIYLVACALQILRFIIYVTSSNVYLFLFASSLQGIMIAVVSVGIGVYIHRKIPSYMLATAMTLYGGIGSIGYAFLAQLFGSVYQYYGSYTVFVVTIVLLLIAFMMVLKTDLFDSLNG